MAVNSMYDFSKSQLAGSCREEEEEEVVSVIPPVEVEMVDGLAVAVDEEVDGRFSSISASSESGEGEMAPLLSFITFSSCREGGVVIRRQTRFREPFPPLCI